MSALSIFRPDTGLDKLVTAAKALYGEGLIILTDHPDAREYLVIARGE